MGHDQKLNLDRESFLAQYWQRKPLLVRNAITHFRTPISRHELAGLALEEDVESRLIEHSQNHWHVHHGPFTEADFQREQPWTLLVQAVDHYIPEVAALRRLMGFIPQWRADDVMVSYATEGGSVGPHYDNYDVFLLQGEGQRLWQLGQSCDNSTALLPHDDLRILSAFEPSEEYLLSPGDMLYVPPGIAHWGIAQGECTTLSIGFRAPSIKDMLARWVDQLLEELEPDEFYRDDGRAAVTRPGEIAPADLERATSQLQSALQQARSNRWFGELVTEPRYLPAQEFDDTVSARTNLEAGPDFIELHAAAKLAWQQEAEAILVYANGECRSFDASVLPSLLILCQTWRLDVAALANANTDPETVKLLGYLMESGVIDVQQ